MTLVAAFIVDNVPLLIGDVLIAGELDRTLAVPIPTVGSSLEVFPGDSGFAPTTLRQKLAVLSPNLAIGWAGSQIAARHVIGDMRARAGRIVTAEDLELQLRDSISDLGALPLDLVGCLRLTPERWHFFGAGSGFQRFESSATFGRGVAAGSGAEMLQGGLVLRSTPGSPGVNPTNQTMNYISAALGYLISKEFEASSPLLQFYGGMYEMIYYDGRTFRKRNDVSFLYLDMAPVKDGLPQITLKLLMKPDYDQGALLVRTLRPAAAGTNELVDRTYVIPEVDSDPNVDGLCRPALEAHTVFQHVRLKHHSPEMIVMRICSEPLPSNNYRHEEQGEQGRISFPDGFQAELCEFVLDVLRERIEEANRVILAFGGDK